MQQLSIDDVFDICGHFGFSQKLYIFVIGMLQLVIAKHMLLNIFAGIETSFICHVKEDNLTLLEDQCPSNDINNCNLEYNTSFISIANEWNYVCNEKYKLALIQSIYMGGVMAGALFLGGVADKIGRQMALMISLIGLIGFESISAFSPNYMTLVVLRFFGGVSCSILILSGFVLSQELIGSSYRSTCGTLMGIFFSIGIGTMSLLASLLSDWRTFTFLSSLFGIVFLFIPFVVPESPRWLLSVGETDQSRNVLVNMAKMNGTYHLLPAHWELSTTRSKKGNARKGSILDLVSHSYVFMITLVMSYTWFITSAAYYALTLASSNLPGNVYVSTTLNGLVEIPALITGVFIINRLGRRIAIVGSLMLSGVACLAIPIVAPYEPSFVNVLALSGKLCISATFAFIYVHSGEIFPTVIRNAGLGIVSVAARVGGIASPFILTLRDVRPNLEFFVLGTFILTAGFLTLKLPETLGRPMPETIDDIIDLGNTPKSKTKGVYSQLRQDEDDQKVEQHRKNFE